MSAASRRKGVAGEREVAVKFEQAGWTVRGLEGGGDHLAVSHGLRLTGRIEDVSPGRIVDPIITSPPRLLHIEVKRQERVRLPEWLEQARAEAPPGVPPVVVFRQSRGQWIAALPLDDLLELIG